MMSKQIERSPSRRWLKTAHPRFPSGCGRMMLVAIVLATSYATSHAAIVADYANLTTGWNNVAAWSTNPTIPNAPGDTVQRLTAFSASRTLTQNIATGVTVGSVVYGNGSDIGNFFWRITLGTNPFTFDEDGIGPGFATFRNSNTSNGNGNALFTNGGTVTLADDLHVVNEAGASTNVNGGVQLASVVTGTGNITFISAGPISSTATSSPGAIWMNSANTFVGTSTVRKGLVVFNTSATPFGNAANSVVLGVNGAGSAGILSRDNVSPINYAITVGSAAVGETRTLGSVADANYTVVSAAGSLSLGGDLNLHAGTASTTAVHQYAAAISGAGGISKTGTAVASLTGANTYAGTTTVSQGTLLVNGSHTGGGAYTVSAQGTLGGTGSIGSAVSVIDGTLSPGASPGTLTLGSSLSLSGAVTGNYELDTPGSLTDDLVQVAGSLDLSGITALTLNVTSLGGPFLADGDYALVDYGGLLVPPAVPVTLTYNGPLNTDQSAAITFDTTGGVVNLTLTTVPEPGTIVLSIVGVGIAFGGRFVRRRR